MDLNHLFTPVSSGDWQIILILIGGVISLVAVAEVIRRKLGGPGEFTRKLVHVLVGIILILIPLKLMASWPVALVALLAAAANYVAIHKGWLKAMHGPRNSYGTVYYPLSFLLLMLICWPDYKIVISAAMVTLALGDAAAAIAGEATRSPHTYRFGGDIKSVEGSLAMFTVSAAGLFVLFRAVGAEMGIDLLLAIGISLLAALIATASEMISTRGSDNLSIPISTALIVYFMITHTPAENMQLAVGILLGLLAAFVSLKLRFLKESGAVALFLLAAVIFGFGGWMWTLPILTFFILSSLLSKAGRKRKQVYDLVFEKGNQRDHGQVIANGGVPGLCMIYYMLSGHEDIYLFYLAALAAATADTWATEIGTLFKRAPRLITTFRPVAPGTSGGITLAGSLSALAGGMVIGLSAAFLDGVTPAGWTLIAFCGISGLSSSMVDSILGATIQAQYVCPSCGKHTEQKIHCEMQTTRMISGFARINNDRVNLLAAISAPFFMYLLLYMLRG